MGSGNACALLRDGAVIDFFGDPPRKNISKDQINFGSVFYAKIERDLKGANGSILDLGKNLKGFIKKSKGLNVGENLIVQCVNKPNEDKLPLFSQDIMIKEKYVIFSPLGKGVSLSKKLRDSDRLR